MKVLTQVLKSFPFDKTGGAYFRGVKIAGGGIEVMNSCTHVQLAAPTDLADCHGVFEAKKVLQALPKFKTVSGDEVAMYFNGPGKLKLAPYLPAKDFPAPPKTETEEQVLFTGLAAFNEAARFCLPCTSQEDSRQYLHGICFDQERLAMVATDGRRLAKYGVPTFSPGKQCIVPTSFFQLVAKLSAVLPAGNIEIKRVAENRIQAEFHGIRIMQDLIDGTFPNWPQVLPKDLNGEWPIVVPEVTAGLKALVGMPYKNRGLAPILITGDTNDVQVHAAGQQFRDTWGEYSFPALPTNKGGIDIQINTRYFLDAVAQVRKNAVLQFDPERPLAGVQFLDPTTPENIVIVMPMKKE